jgi:hypothetical protein
VNSHGPRLWDVGKKDVEGNFSVELGEGVRACIFGEAMLKSDSNCKFWSMVICSGEQLDEKKSKDLRITINATEYGWRLFEFEGAGQCPDLLEKMREFKYGTKISASPSLFKDPSKLRSGLDLQTS